MFRWSRRGKYLENCSFDSIKLSFLKKRICRKSNYDRTRKSLLLARHWRNHARRSECFVDLFFFPIQLPCNLSYLLAWRVLPVSIEKELPSTSKFDRHDTCYFPSIFSIRKFTDFERVTRLSRKKTRSGNKSFKLGKRNYVERRWSFAGLIRGVKGIRKKQKLKGWG